MSCSLTSNEEDKKKSKNSFTLSLTSFVFNTYALDNTQETYDYLLADEYN
jgi:hypothetical protein